MMVMGTLWDGCWDGRLIIPAKNLILTGPAAADLIRPQLGAARYLPVPGSAAC
jgi:hypothetical protein